VGPAKTSLNQLKNDHGKYPDQEANNGAELLNTVEWDKDTSNVIEKDQADEDGHINRWKKLLQASKSEG